MGEEWISDIAPHWTLFLDRDGVINERLIGAYVKTVSEFNILPGVLQAFYEFSMIFDHIIVVTNQSGIGKELMTHGDLETIHNYLWWEVTNAHGRIDQIYYSPDLPHSPHNTRKPSPHMAILAQQEFPQISLEHSIMIGDTQSDIDFGKRLGMKTIWVANDLEDVHGYDLAVSSLYAFSQLLLKR